MKNIVFIFFMKKSQIVNWCLATTNVITVCMGYYYYRKISKQNTNPNKCQLDIDMSTIDPKLWAEFLHGKYESVDIIERNKAKLSTKAGWSNAKEIWVSIVKNDTQNLTGYISSCINSVNSAVVIDDVDRFTIALSAAIADKYIEWKKINM